MSWGFLVSPSLTWEQMEDEHQPTGERKLSGRWESHSVKEAPLFSCIRTLTSHWSLPDHLFRPLLAVLSILKTGARCDFPVSQVVQMVFLKPLTARFLGPEPAGLHTLGVTRNGALDLNSVNFRINLRGCLPGRNPSGWGF